MSRIRTLLHRGRLIAFALIACVMLALGAWYLWNSVRLVRDGDRVQATVVDSLATKTDDGTDYRAIVSYRVDGRDYRRTADDDQSTRPRVGSRRELLVQPDDPENARFDSATELWGAATALLLFGVLLLGAVAWRAGGRAWVRARRGRTDPGR